MSKFEHLIDDLAGDLSPVRPVRPLAGQLLLAAVAAATMLAALSAWGAAGAVAALRPSQATLISGGLFFLLGLAGGWALTCMARPRVGRSSNGWRWAVAAVALLPASALLLVWSGATPIQGADVGSGIGCLARGLGASLASATALTLWLRRGAPMRIETAAWLVGLTSGAVGALAVAATCPDDALTHIGLWHAAIVAAAGGLGRLALPRFLRW